MSDSSNKRITRSARTRRTRKALRSTEDRPRLSVHISNKHVNAQVIDDTKGTTLAAASSVKMGDSTSLTERAEKVGEAVAKAAKTAKISKVVFDRGGKQYHGRIKALADAARKGGLEF